MAKTTSYSGINVKAAVITGGAAGFLLWLFGAWAGFGGMPLYSYMSSMMGYYGYNGMMGYYGGYVGFAVAYFLVFIIFGAIAGAVIAWIYNWALTLK